MNVLLLTSAMDCGGAETHILTLASELCRRGHTVTVASSGGRMVERLRQAGVSHVTLPLHSCLPWHLLTARRGLKKLIKTHRYTLLHAHSRIAAFVADPLSRHARIPLITTVHARFRADPLRRRLSRWGSLAIAVSEDLRQDLTEHYGISPTRVTVIPNGVVLPPYPPALSPSTDKLRLLFCSRLDPDCSAVAFMLCQLALPLYARFPTLELWIVGGGSDLPLLKKHAVSINREARTDLIHLVGHVEDLTDLLPTAHGVVGVSRVALEAMSMGIPVILAGNEGFLGLADEHTLPRAEASNLCCRGEPPVQAESLFFACVSLLSLSQEARVELSRYLRDYTQAHHSAERIVTATEKVYRQAIERIPAPAPADTVLCGYYGYGNTGDDALLAAAILRAKRTFPHTTVSALTKRGKRDQDALGVRCIRKNEPFAVARELKRAERLILGGGTLLQDITSLRSLAYYCAILTYAKHKGARIELWANGLGPPLTHLGKRLMRTALARCDRIGLRDHASIGLAGELLPKHLASRILFEPDLALPTQAASSDRIGFLLRHFRLHTPFAIVVPKGDAGAGSRKLLEEWLCTLRAEGIQLLFLPFYPREDLSLCRRLADPDTDRISEGLSPADITGLMAQSEVVCGMRLHALIFASSTQTPFVGFGTDPKIETFCREHGGVYVTDLYTTRGENT